MATALLAVCLGGPASAAATDPVQAATADQTGGGAHWRPGYQDAGPDRSGSLRERVRAPPASGEVEDAGQQVYGPQGRTPPEEGTGARRAVGTESGKPARAGGATLVAGRGQRNVPSAVQNLEAVAGDGRAVINWDPPATNAGEVTGYEYRFAAGSSVPGTAAWRTTTYDQYLRVTGLQNGTAYRVEVRAAADTETGAVAGVGVTPAPISCASPEVGDRRLIATSTVRVSAEPITTAFVSSSLFTTEGHGYHVDGGIGGIDNPRITIGAQTYFIDATWVWWKEFYRNSLFISLDRPLAPAHERILRVHVCDRGLLRHEGEDPVPPDMGTPPGETGFRFDLRHPDTGPGNLGPNATYNWVRQDLDWSGVSTRTLYFTIPANRDATGAPTVAGTATAGLTLTASKGTVADADGLPATLDYQWVRVDGATETVIPGATGASYVLTDADVGKKIKVRALFTDDLNGEEARDSAETAAVAVGVPSAPLGLVAAADAAQVGLTWAAPASNGGAAITDYEYRHAAGDSVPNSTLWASAGTDLTETVSSLTDGTRYAFEVRAKNSAGGGAAAGIAATPNTRQIFRPSSPTGLAAAPGNARVVLTWSAPLQGSPIGYEYRYAAGSTASATWMSAGTALTQTVSSLTNDTEYTFDVRAQVDSGGGALASVRATPTAVLPAAPANLAAVPGAARVTFAWDAPPSDGGSPVLRYEHRIAAGSAVPEQTPWADGGTDLSAMIAALANGTEYAFEVRAANSVGAGPPARTTATPSAASCAAPALGDRREIWRGQIGVGRFLQSDGELRGLGYGLDGGFGSLDDSDFMIGTRRFAVDIVLALAHGGYRTGGLVLSLTGDTAVPNGAERAAIRVHVCDEAFDLAATQYLANTRSYFWPDAGLDWSDASTRVVRASVPANRNATGDPIVIGYARVGKMLTVSTASLADPNGLVGAVFRYQWIRVDGSRETSIPAATGSTYVPVAADVGKTLKVRVTFLDDLGGAEERTSVETATVVVNKPPASADASVRGVEDEAYAFKVGDFRFTDPDAGDVFAGLTIASLPTRGALLLDGQILGVGARVPKAAFVGAQFRFEPAPNGHGDDYATFSFRVRDDADDSAAAYVMTVHLNSVNDPATGLPTLSRAPHVGVALRVSTATVVDVDGRSKADAGEARHAFAYQWVLVDSGTGTDIAGATGRRYTPLAEEIGKTLKVRVVFHDDDGFRERLESAETLPVATFPGAVRQLERNVGEGRVMVRWQKPEEESGTPLTGYEYRYAAGTSVPPSTTWQPRAINPPYTAENVVDVSRHSEYVRITGLRVGTEYTLEVRAVNVVGPGPPIATKFTPLPVECGMPKHLEVRRVIWTGEIEVGRDPLLRDFALPIAAGGFPTEGHGFWVRNDRTWGSLANPVFSVGSTKYEIDTAVVWWEGRWAGSLFIGFRQALALAHEKALVAHICDHELLNIDQNPRGMDFLFDRRDRDVGGPTVTHTYNWTWQTLDWSVVRTRTMYLSLPGNSPATGAPAITGTPQVGVTLIASQGSIADRDGLPTVFRYQWIRVDGATETAIADATYATYLVAAADIGKTLKVRVSFTDALGTNEERTSEATATVTATMPGPPRDLVAVAGDARVVLTWAAPASDGGSAVIAYQYRSAAGATVPDATTWFSAGTLTQTVSSLTNDTEYAFEVRAVNTPGPGEAAAVLATPRAPTGLPSAPQNLSAAAGDGQVVLAWTAPASDGGATISNYQYRHATGTTSSESWTSAGTDLTETVSSLTNGTAYTFDVRAVNSAGGGLAASTRATPRASGGQLALVLDPGTLAEGDPGDSDATASVQATVAPAQTSAFEVTITARSASARLADDGRWAFADTNRTLSFAPGATAATGTVTLRAVHNDVDDGDLEVAVAGSPSVTAVRGYETVLAITDDDLPKVSVVAAPIAATGHLFEREAAITDAAWVRLTRTGATDEAFVVSVTVSESTGSGTDGGFVAAAEEGARTLTFEAGLAMMSYTPVTADEVAEAHGTVTVRLGASDGYEIATGRGALTRAIRDDDAATLATFRFDPATLTVPEGGSARYAVVAETTTDGTFTQVGDLGRLLFELTAFTPVTVRSSAGTATEGTDFPRHESTLTFAFSDFLSASGGNGLVLRKTPPALIGTEDAVEDPGETFELGFRGALPARTGAGTPSTLTATIVEDPRVQLVLDDVELTEGETATVTATVAPAHDAQFTVIVVPGPPSSARFAFVGSNRTLTFAADAGSSTGTVQILAVDNDADEFDLEDAELRGTASVARIVVEPVTFDVLDNDLPKVSIAAPVLQRNTGHVYEAETAGNDPPLGGRFWLTREGLTDEALEVKVRPSESGGDFVAMTMENTDATVTFGIDATMVSYSPVSRDTDDEMHGTVTATLQSGSTYDIAGAAAATANLRDDDGMPLLTVTVGPAALAVPEGQAARFRALGATVRDGTFSVAGDLGRVFGTAGVAVNAATAAGTATAGTDFTALAADASAMLAYADASVAAGGATAGLELAANLPPIATADDMVDDPDETFTVTVSLPSGVDPRIGVGTPATATATIREGPVVTLALDDAELTENETATVTATVDPAHDAAFTVTVATDPPSSARYGFVGGRTLMFAANAESSSGTVRIRAAPNEVDDGDTDPVTVTGTATVDDIQVEPAMFTVLDDDDPTVSVTRPTAAVDGFMYESEAGSGSDENDDGSGAWTVIRDGDAPEAIDVKVRVAESSPGDGDFVAAADQGERTLTLAVGETSARVYAVTDDTTDEAHGRVTVTLLEGPGYTESTGAGESAVAVRDDDGIPLLTLTVDPAALKVTEGRNAKLYAVATAVDDGTFTAKEHVGRLFDATQTSVTASSADGTATSPGDYAALPPGASATLRFADAERVSGGTFAVRAALPEIATVREADAVPPDPDETFTVTVAKASTETDTRIAAGTPVTATVTLSEGPPDGKLRLCGAPDAAGDVVCIDEDGEWNACESDGACEEQDTPATRDVPLAGRLEIAYSGEWGTVCDDYWTETDAAVACRRLGHAGVVDALVESAAPYGGAAEDVPIWLDDVQCTGEETDLLACPRTGGIAVGAHNCPTRPRHQEDAGVRCAATTEEARGHLIFRTPDGVEHERNASLTVAAGAIARYGIRLSTKPVVLKDGYGQLYVDIDGAANGVLSYPERHVWAAPDDSDPDDDRWTQAREVTVSVSPGASGEVVLAHTADRHGHPDNNFAGTYRLTVTVERARAGRPGAPADLSVQAQGAVDVLAEWQPPADAGAAALEGYRLESRAGGGWDEIAATEPDDTYHYDLDALQDVRSRDYRVAAANAHGAGPYAAAATATRPAPSSAARGAVYLAGGSVPWEGAVTVFRDGAWVAACAAGWDLGGAHAACRRAGYARALQAYTVAALGTACGSGRSAGAVCAPPAGTETGAPRLTEASADGARVTLRFDAPLDATFAPAPRDFLVLSGGPDAARRRDHPVLSASVAGATLELRVAPPVEPGAAVGVGYLRPALHPLRAAAGGAAVDAFENAVVRNPAADLDDGPGDVALNADSAPHVALKDTDRLAVDGRSAPSARWPVPLELEAGLRAAIAAALADGAEPWSLVTLDASGRRMDDLAGIESLTALQELNLAGNALGDIRALADLPNLRVLDLSGNRVADLWPLAGLARLERLALSGNRIADPAPLAGLERLRVLDLSHNAVTDLAALGGLDALEYLALAGNGLWNADRLAKLRRLVRLDLADNALADVGALWELRNVVWLRVSGNRVATVDGLGRLVRLRWVWLADNPLVRGAASSVRGLPPRVWTDLPADRGARDGR